MDNNDVLRRIRYILDLNDETMMKIFSLADRKISQSELSSFFRSFTQEQYCSLNDQYLRNFLIGLQIKFRQNNSDTSHE